MNRYIFILILSISYLLLLTACIKEVDDIDLPNENPELVVASFISPTDSINSLILTWSKPIFGNQSNNWGTQYEEDASVSISDGTLDYSFTYDPAYMVYTLDTSILKYQSGKTYTMKIKYKDHELDAETQIPAEPLYKVEHLNSIVTYKDEWYTEYKHNFIFTVKDNAEKSYYRVLFQIFRDGYNISYNERFIEGQFNEEFKFEAFSYYNTMDSINTDEMIINIISCSKDYYLYHQSMNNYTGDNPFGEPTIIYSNIDSGLGIFGGFQMKKETMMLTVPQ